MNQQLFDEFESDIPRELRELSHLSTSEHQLLYYLLKNEPKYHSEVVKDLNWTLAKVKRKSRALLNSGLISQRCDVNMVGDKFCFGEPYYEVTTIGKRYYKGLFYILFGEM